jgi:hypothetical protein
MDLNLLQSFTVVFGCRALCAPILAESGITRDTILRQRDETDWLRCCVFDTWLHGVKSFQEVWRLALVCTGITCLFDRWKRHLLASLSSISNAAAALEDV